MRARSGGEHIQQGGVPVDDLAPALLTDKNADPFQFLEVLGSGLAFRDAGIHDECDLAVGLLEPGRLTSG